MYFRITRGIDPKCADAWYNKGSALDNLGKRTYKTYKKAIEYYDKALEIDPKYADAWYNKGTVLLNLLNLGSDMWWKC